MRTSMVYAVLAVVVGGVACSDKNSGVQTAYTATLNQMFTVPPDTSAGTATLTISVSGLSVTGNLVISTLGGSGGTTAYTVGHIHAGNAGANGAVLLNLCGTALIAANPATNNPGQAATPACAVGTIPISYTSPSSTSGMPGNPTTTWTTFVGTIENGGNYAQLHSAIRTSTVEIRGQILRVLQTY